MSSPYAVVLAAASEAAATMVRLWSNSFDMLQGAHAEKKVAHFYLRNPAGSGPVFLLRENTSGADVGVQTLVLRRFHAGSDAYLAGNLADYAVDAAHRSLGPALQLMKASIADSKTRLAFLYGLPNRKAEPILRRAGLEPVLEMARFAAPLRTRSYLEGRVPALLLGVVAALADTALSIGDRLRSVRRVPAIRWETGAAGDAIDSDIDSIWQGAVQAGLLLSERSAAVLRWRFDGRAVQIAIARDRRSNEPLGYVVWALRDGVAVVSDFLCAEPGAGTSRVFAAFRCHARAAGACSISLEYGGSPAIASALSDAGFSRREGHPLYAVINQTLPATQSWYFTGFDRDTD